MKASAERTWRGSGTSSICGMNSLARTIGPATRWAKKVRYTAKSSSGTGRVHTPRPMSIT